MEDQKAADGEIELRLQIFLRGEGIYRTSPLSFSSEKDTFLFYSYSSLKNVKYYRSSEIVETVENYL